MIVTVTAPALALGGEGGAGSGRGGGEHATTVAMTHAAQRAHVIRAMYLNERGAPTRIRNTS